MTRCISVLEEKGTGSSRRDVPVPFSRAAWTVALAAALLLAPLLCGCPPSRGPSAIGDRPPASVETVDTMLVQVAPTPVDWDGRPGPDGLMVAVTFFRQPAQLPVTVRGAVEFHLYEGILRGEDLNRAKPLHSWQFSGAQLDASRARSAFGWGYVLRLDWASRPPGTSSVTLVPAYLPPAGPAIRHDPIVVTITAK